MTLFDPDDYNARGATPRAPKRPRVHTRKHVTVAIRASHTWRLVQQRYPGVVHAQRGREKGGSYQTWCGVYATPLTFDPDQIVNGCLACIERMRAFGVGR